MDAPAMRCKPGDLAVIIRADNDPEALGAVVTVKRICIAMGELAWEVEPKFYWHDETGLAYEVAWDDRDLQPIRGQKVGRAIPEVKELQHDH